MPRSIMSNSADEMLSAFTTSTLRSPTKRHDDGLLLNGKNGGPGTAGPRPAIRGRVPLPPLGNGLRVDAMPPSQHPQALLTMLYRATDRRCRCGAPVENLSHSASFHALEKYAP